MIRKYNGYERTKYNKIFLDKIIENTSSHFINIYKKLFNDHYYKIKVVPFSCSSVTQDSSINQSDPLAYVSYDFEEKYLGLYFNIQLLNENDNETLKKLLWHELLHLIRNDLEFENILNKAKLNDIPKIKEIINTPLFFTMANSLLNIIQDAFINEDIGLNELIYKTQKISSIKFDNVLQALENAFGKKLPHIYKMFYTSSTVEIFRAVILEIIDQLLEMQKEIEQDQKLIEEFFKKLTKEINDILETNGTNGGNPDYNRSLPGNSTLTENISDLVKDVLISQKKDIIEKLKNNNNNNNKNNNNDNDKSTNNSNNTNNDKDSNGNSNSSINNNKDSNGNSNSSINNNKDSNDAKNQKNSTNNNELNSPLGKKSIDDARAEAISKNNKYSIDSLEKLRKTLEALIAEKKDKIQQAGNNNNSSFILSIIDQHNTLKVDDYLFNKYFYKSIVGGRGNTKVKTKNETLDVSEISNKYTHYFGVSEFNSKKKHANPLIILDTSGSFSSYIPFYVDLLNRLEKMCNTEFTVISFSGSPGIVNKEYNSKTRQYEYVFTDYDGGTVVQPIFKFLTEEFLSGKHKNTFNQVAIISDFDFYDIKIPEFFEKLIDVLTIINKKNGYSLPITETLVITNNISYFQNNLQKQYNLIVEDTEHVHKLWLDEHKTTSTKTADTVQNQNDYSIEM